MSGAAKRFLPLLDRVLVQKLKAETQTKAGIFLPDTAKGPSNLAKVLAVGTGKITKEGATVPCSVKEGDTVVIPEYGGMTIKIEGEEFHVFHNEDLIGVMKD
ncbi:unnamed protein product [Vitrella brassicaformis CCMP3155]|uniref:10 kDa chaperonin n=1 Tax=Vitrella brassicaformis (strain CCMP3155) TaxID=1169540 RepID=A0A0G4FDK0_VITBC|nr:unnamed protein product [Vitrella brassicaformis CCMP3155]|mmetsp:Transcript_7636/g.18678  ORF Transcript_7636/g.18678 Transcript_7636/m.18678 type:complete len:102 (+) Transcript_7636:101-406(+)|eukprot:CEM10998.1 unnamed protein product [Vitrella brassicaformis CCMP3155]